jgi:hypothetical protein
VFRTGQTEKMKNSNLRAQTVVLGCLVFFCIASLCAAKNIFVAQSAAGSATGTTSADAYPLSWLNTAVNWVNGSVQAGDTVHLVGTFTSGLTLGGSGTAVNPITVLFEPGAKFSAPTWTGKIIGGSMSYVIVDGGQNGLIEATDNGFGLSHSDNFNAVDITVGPGVEIRNLTIKNLFVRTSNSVDCVNAPSAIRIGGTMKNLAVHNCNITNIGNGIVVYPQGGVNTNIQIYSNSVFNCSWGIYCEPASPGALIYNTKIWANRINNGYGWDGCPGPFHQDGIIVGVPTMSSTNYDVEIYRNWIGPVCGYSSTSAIYLESTQDNNYNQNPRIYNNVIIMGAGQRWNSGIIAANASGTKIYNNTLVGMTFPAGIAFQIVSGLVGADIQNNFVMNVATMYHQPLNAPQGFYPRYITNIDYNVGASVGNWWDPGSFTWSGSTSYRDHLTFPQFSNFDNHSSNRTPACDANYQPLPTDTVLVGKGTNLSSFFTTDFNGNTRPATGRWTIGAYETTGTALPLQPPKTLHPPTPVTP